MSTGLTQRGKSPRYKTPKLLFFGFLAVTALWSLYVGVTNIFIPDHLQSAAHEAGIELRTDSVRSLYPGHLRLTGVVLTDTASGWEVRATRASCRLDLWRLLMGETHITNLTASGADVEVENAPNLAGTLAKLPYYTSRSLWRGNMLQPLREGTTPASLSSRAPVTIEDIRATGNRLQIGPHHLTGDFEYSLTQVRVGPTGGSAQLKLRMADASLKADPKPPSTLTGTLEARVAPDVSQSSVWKRASGRLKISGSLASLEPWLNQVDTGVELRAAKHRLDVGFAQGEIRSGSIVLSAEQVEIEHGDLGRTQLSGAVRLNVQFQEQQSPAIFGELTAQSLRLIDAAKSNWANLDGVRFSLRLPRPGSDPPDAKTGARLEASIRHARLAAGDYELEAPLKAEAEVRRFELESGQLVLGEGSLQAKPASLVSGTKSHPLSATLELESARLTVAGGLDFTGRLAIRGEDAGMFLDMADADETVRWTLSLLDAQPFTLQAEIRRGVDRLELPEVSFDAGALQAQGIARSRGHTFRGAFVVDAPFPIGVTLDSSGIQAQAPIASDWFASQTRALIATQ